MANKPAPHLRDLFLKGQEYEFKSPPATGVKVWVQRPSSVHQEVASRAARAKRARRRTELLSPESEEHKSLKLEINELSLDQITDELLGLRRADFQRQALNEVLYSEEHGSDWGKEGEKYMDLLEATVQRIDEITKAAEEEGVEPKYAEDPEWKRLNELQMQFQKEVDERQAEITDMERSELVASKTVEEIKSDYFRRHVDAESDGVWYMEYKQQMLYFAVRHIDDHARFYFESATEIGDMPVDIQRELLEVTESLNLEADELKNSLTPQAS